MREFDMKAVGRRLWELRLEKGVSQNQMAAELSLSNASISYWVNGKQEPTASAIVKAAIYFNVSTDYLLGLKEY